MNVVVIIGRPTREYQSTNGHTRFRVVVDDDERPGSASATAVNVQPGSEHLDLFRTALTERCSLAIDGRLGQVDDGHATVLVENAVLITPMSHSTFF